MATILEVLQQGDAHIRARNGRELFMGSKGDYAVWDGEEAVYDGESEEEAVKALMKDD